MEVRRRLSRLQDPGDRGVAASLGYEDHERAPADEMLAAAGQIATAVNVPVTVDAEAGYEMEPTDLVTKLKEMGAAGCNLEDTNHATAELRDPVEQADRLRAVRGAASGQAYGLVINARIDVFLPALASGAEGKGQAELVGQALRRAHAYLEAGADCVFPFLLREPDALQSFISDAPGPVNVLKIPPAPSHAELAELGVARISYGGLLHRDAMEQFGRLLESLPGAPADEHPGPHELHHIDGNPMNNRPDNLIMLSPDCHRRVGRDPSRSRPHRAS
jgi:2-methylisocitrate lyase-like PEP mutase family enzyme